MITRAGTQLTLNWSGGSGNYAVQKKVSLSDSTWIDLTTTSNLTMMVPVGNGNEFFRVVQR